MIRRLNKKLLWNNLSIFEKKFMRFNSSDSALLLLILTQILQNLSTENTLKTEQFSLIIERIKAEEYIKGKLLNFLFMELNRRDFKLNSMQEIEFEALLKRIKFKATPR